MRGQCRIFLNVSRKENCTMVDTNMGKDVGLNKSKGFASQDQTGFKDEHYDLISALYHTLQSAETCEQYIADAEQSGDEDLVNFFRQCQQSDMQRAMQCKQILAKKLQNFSGGVNDVNTSVANQMGNINQNVGPQTRQ
jgi:hypothetical protein